MSESYQEYKTRMKVFYGIDVEKENPMNELVKDIPMKKQELKQLSGYSTETPKGDV